MFGYLRFFLALLVLISHLDIRWWGLNPGVIAVVIFYILAGYVVSYLFSHIIPQGRHKVWYFYLDRIRRIFPLYLYVLGLTLLFLVLTHYGTPNFSPLKLLGNLLIIPLNYYMLLDNTILTEPAWWLIPPAWSLGTELQAYILLPFALLYRYVRYAFILLSFFIYTVANFSLIQPDYFGYRLIVGVMFIFLVGSSLQRLHLHPHDRTEHMIIRTIWSATLVLISLSFALETYSVTYTVETFIGLIVGIPLVYLLSQSSIKLPWNRQLGALSYGLFLSHFLAIWVVDYAELAVPNSTHEVLWVLGLSSLIALVGVRAVEKRAF